MLMPSAPEDSVAEPPLRMLLELTVPPESTTSGSPAEMLRPLLVTPEETIMVIGRSFAGLPLPLGSRSIRATPCGLAEPPAG